MVSDVSVHNDGEGMAEKRSSIHGTRKQRERMPGLTSILLSAFLFHSAPNYGMRHSTFKEDMYLFKTMNE
jgi:hypothetical protein